MANEIRKVVDSNYLQNVRLRDYLSTSPKNMVVLSDYVSMEAYKGNTLPNIHERMGIVSKFPSQVLILKSTIVICGLSGRNHGLQKRFIDARQTNDFAKYCMHLKQAQNGNRSLQNQLLSLGEEANSYFEKSEKGLLSFGQSIDAFNEIFTERELKRLRRNEPLSDEMVGKFLRQAAEIARRMFEQHPAVRRWPTKSELPNTFIFRHALCGMVLALGWMQVGGAPGVSAKRHMNDLVDVGVATYGTYFDGILTRDKKLTGVFERTRFLVESARRALC